MYGISPDGEEAESVTVLQKTPPVLTPPQYGLVVQAGGDPSADYRVEIVERTFKGENDLPDTPGRQQALENNSEAPDGEMPSSPPQDISPEEESANGNSEPPLRGEDAAIGGILDEEQSPKGNEDPVEEGQITADRSTPGNPMLEPQAPADELPVPEADAGESGDLPDDAEVLEPTTTDGAPTEVPGLDPTMPPPEDFDANDFDPLNPTLLPGVEPSVLIPGPVDPLAPVITESNPFADYFDPFFGTYLPARGEEPVLSNGEDGYIVNDLFVFGDRLTENGGEFGKNAVAESTGANPPYDVAPYSELGNFTDGLNWTTYLASILGVEDYAEQDTNFSYLDATARDLVNPVDPFGEATELNTFAGQIDTFEENYGTFTEDDLVVVNFSGNDLTLPPGEGVAPEEAAQQSIQATVDGIANLQELGAENFLVGLVPPVELAPIFSDEEFQAILGVEPGFFGPVVEGYNQGLTAALEEYEAASGANIEILDVNTLFDAIAEEPGSYGFVNLDEPVLSSQTPLTGEPPEYNEAIVGEDPAVQHGTLFIDPFFHPTALGHSIIAETARNELFDLGEDVSEPTLEDTGIIVGLYDADEDTLIASLFDQIDSVFLNFNDGQVTRTENWEPYALFGDNGEDYFSGGMDLQEENTIAFDLYSGDELGGEMLGNMNGDFTVV
ncbi:MAG TPA: SGNH/GDSL hydrolase family protein, partial [Xenococcaceae cyanobacterium]